MQRVQTCSRRVPDHEASGKCGQLAFPFHFPVVVQIQDKRVLEIFQANHLRNLSLLHMFSQCFWLTYSKTSVDQDS